MTEDLQKYLKRVSWDDVPYQRVDGLDPYQVIAEDGATTGLFTGYFEPILRGSLTKKPPFVHAVYGQSYLTPKVTRREVMDGALDKQNIELLYVDDAVDLFFAHVQGSAVVKLDTGQIQRIGFAGKSGHPYTAIGKTLKDMGVLSPPITMQSIKDWLRANPAKQKDVFCSNASFIFFKMRPPNGPIGASGEVLMREASLAIDDSIWPYGLDVIVATTSADKPFIRRLRTCDKGSAIKGVIRGDIYFGSGDAAGAVAGAMNAQGSMWVLLPS